MVKPPFTNQELLALVQDDDKLPEHINKQLSTGQRTNFWKWNKKRDLTAAGELTGKKGEKEKRRKIEHDSRNMVAEQAVQAFDVRYQHPHTPKEYNEAYVQAIREEQAEEAEKDEMQRSLEWRDDFDFEEDAAMLAMTEAELAAPSETDQTDDNAAATTPPADLFGYKSFYTAVFDTLELKGPLSAVQFRQELQPWLRSMREDSEYKGRSLATESRDIDLALDRIKPLLKQESG
ncbi:hypothetical protein CLAFUW4_07436 [Fulvia fulva]|uniref:Uncharacterized protein n=1 Tax=Passalora fulva TaxID=5499 RepID=A0A9Q8UQX1_PASFU|nr:uncharacterized protein CLAFUR5_07566 [Fulvia fulva]KAK4622103.1 hypothetical protein CLAFUR4_07443 [Fulvia fulva]KAK4622898.1 hypothetical protein CLAFUR0_07442 [Fulvia fulva]UJO19107.1 hypothetical protein CLAFUR5_07566 [Fulvia fulva]WPV16109.1 hypothetical protein CLAFUW4_07436 [Fulvia fulva]WPV31516.1 hypothetical protein CLAFUW7_07439 [Fulvia fulva]